MSEDLLGGRYRLDSELGHGGMATVWRATDTRLDRPVAIKVLQAAAARIDPAAQERFNREAWTIARLTNIHVVRVYDVGVDNDRQFLVMELVEGTNLANLIAAGPLDVSRAIDIARQVCDALSAAHAVDVVHRDIKPGNILIDGSGTVKLCDFGIARLVGASQSTLTRAGTTIGTSQYMAPEQVSGDPVDGRTDLYALGCVLYAMLTGTPPFHGDAPLGIAHQQLHREPEPVAARRPGLPAALADLVDRLLAKNPADRPQSAADVRAALETAGNGPAAASAAGARGSAQVVSHTRIMPAYDETAHSPYAPYPPPNRNRWPLIAAAAVVLVILVVIVAALLSDRSNPNRNAGSRTGASSTPATTTTTTSPTQHATTEAPSGDPLDALQHAIEDQAAAGTVDGDAANEISSKIDDVRQAQQDGKGNKVADKVDELVKKIAEARDSGKIDGDGWTVIEPLVSALKDGLPTGNGNGDDGNGNN